MVPSFAGVEIGPWVRVRCDRRRYFVERRDIDGWTEVGDGRLRIRSFYHALYLAESVARACRANPPFTESLDDDPASDQGNEER